MLLNQHLLRRETRKMSSENKRMLRAETALGAEIRFIARARQVLRHNDMGDWTRAAPNLYPHQWSWDSAFIAIGLAHLGTRRAAKELLTLFEHQWRSGKVPHIVFNPEAPPDSYFPGPEHWACAAASPDAPPRRPTPAVFVSPRSTPLPPYAFGRWPREAGERGSKKRELSCGRSSPSSSFGTATS